MLYNRSMARQAMSITVDGELHAKLVKMAQVEKRDISRQIEYLIEPLVNEWANRYGREKFASDRQKESHTDRANRPA